MWYKIILDRINNDPLGLDQAIWRKEYKSEDDFAKSVEECKDPECRDHSVILYKGLSNQRKLEAVEEDAENGEVVMTTLNGLPKSWDSFIQGICARRKLITFSRLWEECSQEEAQIVAWEEKMGNEDQSLTAHTKKIKKGALSSQER